MVLLPVIWLLISNAIVFAEEPPEWTSQETWTWKQIKAGQVADLSLAFGGNRKPNTANTWPEERILRPAFIEQILLQPSLSSQIPHYGVRIIGAHFRKRLDLSGATIPHTLWLDFCKFDRGIDIQDCILENPLSLEGSRILGRLDGQRLESRSSLFLQRCVVDELKLLASRIEKNLELSGLKVVKEAILGSTTVEGHVYLNDAKLLNVSLLSTRIGKDLSLERTHVQGRIDCDRMTVRGSVFLRSAALNRRVGLVEARIGRDLDCTGAYLADLLYADGAQIDGDVHFNKGRLVRREENNKRPEAGSFRSIRLNGAKIAGNLSLLGASVDSLLADGSDIGGSLAIRNRTLLRYVRMAAAKIGRNLNILETRIDHGIQAESSTVEGTVKISNTVIPGPINFAFSKIGRAIHIEACSLSTLDLEGASVDQSIVIGVERNRRPLWYPDSQLILRNANTRNFQDTPNSWPNTYNVTGFTYESLGAHHTVTDQDNSRSTDLAIRDVHSLTKWLRGNQPFSPQPYEQLASTLVRSGRSEDAKVVLYDGRDESRRRKGWLDWTIASISMLTIGYGLYPLRSVIWILLAIIAGMLVLARTGQGKANQLGTGFWYSLDLLLPIIKLSEAHYTVELSGVARTYFFILKLLGYVLASFLIAGITGLTTF